MFIEAHCTRVQISVDAAGLCVQVGSQYVFWHTTPHCMSEVLYQSGLDLPGLSSSYSPHPGTAAALEGSLHITASRVVLLSVNIEWEILSLIAHRVHACSI